MVTDANLTDYALFCPESRDDWNTWPRTAAGENATRPCPKHMDFTNAVVLRYCTVDGTWANYTYYNNCILPKLRSLFQMCENFGELECSRIANVTRVIEMVGLSLSLISLILSLYIFFTYRILKNNRTKIHKNLFFATLLQVFFRLIKYVLTYIDPTLLNENIRVDEISTVLMEYAKTAMFTWMFIEGLYLHNVITVTVFHEYLRINFYIWCGWLVPAIMTIIWLGVMLAKDVIWKFYYFLPYFWILEGPRSCLIIINLLFLLNILRVLIVKLRQTHSSEIEQVRKAVRAAIFLLPLLGTAHTLFLLDYTSFNDAWKFELWSYLSYFLNTFQGFFVAVLYCFLNGEVQGVVKNSYFTRVSLRRNNYTACRVLTASTVGTDTDMNNSSERNSWMKCCNEPPHSPEEKEIALCDIKEKRDGSAVISTVEVIPMTRTIPNNSSNGVNTWQAHKRNGATPKEDCSNA